MEEMNCKAYQRRLLRQAMRNLKINLADIFPFHMESSMEEDIEEEVTRLRKLRRKAKRKAQRRSNGR